MINHYKIPLPTLKRYYLYYNILKHNDNVEWVSTSVLSVKTSVKPITIRKDIAHLGIKGSPQKGYPKKELTTILKNILGGDSYGDLILVGTWGIGSVIRDTPGLISKDFNVRVCFDFVEERIHNTIQIYPMSRLEDLIPRLGISMAILSVEQDMAQEVCDKLFDYGIKGILNVTHVHLKSKESNNIVNYDLMSGLSEVLWSIKS